jgi:lipopolysaccharide transport system ATP-binding protein
MSGDWTVRVDSLWRKFGASAQGALKYGVIDAGRRLLGRDKDSDHLRSGEFWALQDVSFELHRGEALGIMGVNGSGKTTLLRLLNGTYSPDRGSVSLRGRVGSLIAAGAGFSPLLSGRENVHINGLLLGMTPAEIRRRFDEIVSFAGLEEFIDMPVRNYSSGMTVRLGFSIATNTAPDVLLVDEVLAVGDLAFQKRCFDRMLGIRRQGSTVILVSHSVGAVWSMCDSGLFLNRGISSGKVSVEELGRLYDLQNFRNAAVQSRKENQQELTADAAFDDASEDALASLPREHGGNLSGGTGDALIKKIRVCDTASWQDRSEFEFGEAIGLEMHVYVAKPVPEAIFRYTVDAASYRFICNVDSAYDDGLGLFDLAPGHFIIRTTIEAPRFTPGSFDVNANICQKSFEGHLYFRHKAASFVIRPPKDRFFYELASPAVVHFDARFEVAASQPLMAADGTTGGSAFATSADT